MYLRHSHDPLIFASMSPSAFQDLLEIIFKPPTYHILVSKETNAHLQRQFEQIELEFIIEYIALGAD